MNLLGLINFHDCHCFQIINLMGFDWFYQKGWIDYLTVISANQGSCVMINVLDILKAIIWLFNFVFLKLIIFRNGKTHQCILSKSSSLSIVLMANQSI